MDLTKTEWEGVDWVHVAYDRDQRRALMDTVLKVRITKGGEFHLYLPDLFLKFDYMQVLN
jgi:hypothetical protein